MGGGMREEAPEGVFLARPHAPAAGIPLAVKDLFDTAGLVTTYGSAIFADNLPATSAEAVRRLEAAGYANVGKTNLHEFAYGITSQNPHYGTVPNPVAPGRTSGGSSGGNGAALAAGRVDPYPGRLLRSGRLQAHLRTRVHGRVLSARLDLRPRRADGADRRRLRADARRPRRRARAPEARARGHYDRRGVDGARRAARRPPGGGGGGTLPAQAVARLPAATRDLAGVPARGRRCPPRSLRRVRRPLRRQRAR